MLSFKHLTRPCFSILAVYLISLSFIFWATRVNDPRVTSWDVYGYYMYLPQTFIEHDPGNAHLDHLVEMQEKYQLGPSVNMVHKTEKGYYLSQYGFGMSLFYLPAFVTGHTIAKISGYAADGYSPPYQYSMIWWQVIYMIMAFMVLRKTLLHFFDARMTALLLLTVCFGTNFYLYATTIYGMSHAYLFFAYTLVLYLTVRWHQTFSRKHAIGLGLVLGLMIVSRPSEAIACIIPALWGIRSWETLKEKCRALFQNKIALLLLVLSVSLLPVLQMVYWKIYAGQYLYYSYLNYGEGFEFKHPHTFDFLFSFRKGWFLYTPIMLVAVAALFATLFRRKDFSFALVVFTCINIYVLSSWSTWWYAASFGQRPVIQSYPLYLLGIGVVFGYLHRRKQMLLRILPVTVCSLAIALNLFQAWQARHDIIHPERMTGDYYFAVFGRTEVPPGADSLLMVDRSVTMDTVLHRPHRYTLKEHFTMQKVSALPDDVFVLDTGDIFSKEMNIPYTQLSERDHAWLHIHFEVQALDSAQLDDLELAFCFFNKHRQVYNWNTDRVKNRLKAGANGWQRYSLYCLTPVIRLPTDLFHTKLMKAKGSKMRIRHFSVDVWQPKH